MDARLPQASTSQRSSPTTTLSTGACWPACSPAPASASSPRAGGREASTWPSGFIRDVVLIDRRMNDLDGFEATRLIHASSDTARTPVIAVTASAFGDVREAAGRRMHRLHSEADPRRRALRQAAAAPRRPFRTSRAGRRPAGHAPDTTLPPRMPTGCAKPLAVGDVPRSSACARARPTRPAARGFASQISVLTRAFDFEALTALIDRQPKEASGNGAI